MKNLTPFVLILIVFTAICCNFSVGTNKDLRTGLSYTYNGFSVEESVLAGPDNTALTTNEVSMNSKVSIVLNGISNYTLKDNKAFPGLSLLVSDAKGEPVINEADLFAGGEGYSVEDASALRGTITVGDPMASGQTYHVKMRVWDKNKPESEIVAEVDLKVK